MPRMSVVIFHFHRVDLLEETLISVLQHRPTDCEVLVLHDGSYQDPYDLGDEVRFVEVPGDASLPFCANRGMVESRGDVIHYLAGGVTVTPQWCESALGYFEDSSVAAVTPVLMDSNDEHAVCCVGVRESRLMNRLMVAKGKHAERHTLSRLSNSVPNLVAAFYRRSVLQKHAGFRADIGNELADLDLGLRLKSGGFELVTDVDCEMKVGEIDPPPKRTAWDQGRDHQRFLESHRAEIGKLRSAFATASNGLMEVLTSPRSPSRLATAFGRLRQYREDRRERRENLEREAAPSTVLSIDEARQRNASSQPSKSASGRRAA